MYRVPHQFYQYKSYSGLEVRTRDPHPIDPGSIPGGAFFLLYLSLRKKARLSSKSLTLVDLRKYGQMKNEYIVLSLFKNTKQVLLIDLPNGVAAVYFTFSNLSHDFFTIFLHHILTSTHPILRRPRRFTPKNCAREHDARARARMPTSLLLICELLY